MSQIWSCKIGECDGVAGSSDNPMRQAVSNAYYHITGCEPKFIFSGWGAELMEEERAVVENRQPEYDKTEYGKAKNAAARIRELEAQVAALGLAAEAVGRLIAAIRDNCPHVLAVTILTQAKVRAPISDRKIYATAQEYWTAMQEWMERKPVAAKGVFVDIPDTEPSI